jgi:TolA-binding protein
MAGALDPRALGRAVAEAEDAALARRRRPPLPTEERLARIHAELRRMSGVSASTSLRGPVAAGLALGAVAAGALLWPRGEPLRFTVGEPQAQGVAGLWVAAPPVAPTAIGFSDGSRIVVGAGAWARVSAVSERGARVVVERGTVSVDVVPRQDNDWSVFGGPFEIHVTGTGFDASWDPAREELGVTMRHGRVVVRSACLAAERTLGDGETATISCARPAVPAREAAPPPGHPSGEVEREGRARRREAVAEIPPEPPVVVPREAGKQPERDRSPAAAPSLPTESTGTGTGTGATAATVASVAPSWRELARAARYPEALAAAEAEGFGRLCDELPAADLIELGAVARLGSRTARAAEAYTAVRKRFPGGDAAAEAAFHLGQLTFDGAHAFAEAHRWFLVYLAERPGGALEAEAMGRALEAEQRLGDLAAARATAAQYLTRHPAGAHAALARSLLVP